MIVSVAVELKEVRSLVTLSDLGNLSLVAERLHLSPPAIHKQLKTLEAELGVKLYEKAGDHLQLTQAAEVLLPHMRELLVQYGSALSALQEWKGMKSGTVRVGTGPSAYVLPAILKKFRKKYPGIEVLVETANTPALLNELNKGSLDVVLVVSSDLNERQNFCVEMAWDFEFVLVSHLRHPPLRPHMSELRKHRFLLFRNGSRMQNPIDRYFADHEFEPEVAMRCDNADFIRSMVRVGLGLAWLPLWVVERDLKERHLKMIRPQGATPSSKIALVRRKSDYVPRTTQAFIETARILDHKQLPLLHAPIRTTHLDLRKENTSPNLLNGNGADKPGRRHGSEVL